MHSHIGTTLALSTCVHALVFAALTWTFSGAKGQTSAPALQIVLSPRGSQGILAPSSNGARGFRKQQAPKNPPAPFSKGGEETTFSLAQQTGEGDFAAVKSGGGASPNNILKPEYTQRALRLGIQGEVVLEVTIRADGNVASARVTKGLGYGLDEAARDAILKSTFLPAKNAEGVSISEQIIYRFRFELTT